MAKMIKLTTKSGFKCEVADNCADDAEFLVYLDELQNGNPIFAIRAAQRMLGSKKYDELCDHIRTTDDRVPFTVLVNEFTELLNEYTALTKR